MPLLPMLAARSIFAGLTFDVYVIAPFSRLEGVRGPYESIVERFRGG